MAASTIRFAPVGAVLRGQRGATAVEFAIVAIFFFSLMIGIVDFGRWLFAMNSAAEATRLGARVAVVCDVGAAAIKQRMIAFFPGEMPQSAIVVTYRPTGCTVANCESVTVELTGAKISSIAWFLPIDLPLGNFLTTLPRESMKSSIDGSANPQCV